MSNKLTALVQAAVSFVNSREARNQIAAINTEFQERASKLEEERLAAIAAAEAISGSALNQYSSALEGMQTAHPTLSRTQVEQIIESQASLLIAIGDIEVQASASGDSDVVDATAGASGEEVPTAVTTEPAGAEVEVAPSTMGSASNSEAGAEVIERRGRGRPRKTPEQHEAAKAAAKAARAAKDEASDTAAPSGSSESSIPPQPAGVIEGFEPGDVTGKAGEPDAAEAMLDPTPLPNPDAEEAHEPAIPVHQPSVAEVGIFAAAADVTVVPHHDDERPANGDAAFGAPDFEAMQHSGIQTDYPDPFSDDYVGPANDIVPAKNDDPFFHVDGPSDVIGFAPIDFGDGSDAEAQEDDDRSMGDEQDFEQPVFLRR